MGLGCNYDNRTGKTFNILAIKIFFVHVYNYTEIVCKLQTHIGQFEIFRVIYITVKNCFSYIDSIG